MVSGPKTFKEQTLWARNAEEALFALGYACAGATGELRRICWPRKPPLALWSSVYKANAKGLKII